MFKELVGQFLERILSDQKEDATGMPVSYWLYWSHNRTVALIPTMKFHTQCWCKCFGWFLLLFPSFSFQKQVHVLNGRWRHQIRSYLTLTSMWPLNLRRGFVLSFTQLHIDWEHFRSGACLISLTCSDCVYLGIFLDVCASTMGEWATSINSFFLCPFSSVFLVSNSKFVLCCRSRIWTGCFILKIDRLLYGVPAPDFLSGG